MVVGPVGPQGEVQVRLSEEVELGLLRGGGVQGPEAGIRVWEGVPRGAEAGLCHPR